MQNPPDIRRALARLAPFLCVVAAPAICDGAAPCGPGTVFDDQQILDAQKPSSIALGDFNNDGELDIATDSAGPFEYFSVLINTGDGTFAPQQTYAVGTDTPSVTAADLDADGDTDLVTANTRSDDVSVLLNTGDGTFAPQQTFAAGDGPVSVTPADLNGDGNLDLATANGGSGNMSVLLNQLDPVTPCPGDTNNDNTVDFNDLLTLLDSFGNTCP